MVNYKTFENSLNARPKLLVIGCASNDILHLEPVNKTVRCPGGAGLYTALSAQAAGAKCTLLAPKPDGFVFIDSDKAGIEWIGPKAGRSEFPHLEIRHHGNDKATLCSAAWGAEAALTPNWLPSNITDYSIIHIAALSSAVRQLSFLQEIRSKSNCIISVGTYGKLASGETSLVRELVRACDFAFMNENEASYIFNEQEFPISTGSGKTICISRGRQGASIYNKNLILSLQARSVNELDPTGAGDSFAGTLLGKIACGCTLEEAAEAAVYRSSMTVTEAGPAAILKLLDGSDEMNSQ